MEQSCPAYIHVIDVAPESQGQGSLCVSLVVDMRSYLQAYRDYIFASEQEKKEAKRHYDESYAAVVSLVSGLRGDLWWEDVLDQFRKVSGFLESSFEGSPADIYMADSFVEIIKNTIDEAIMSALDSESNAAFDGVIELKVVIDTQTHPHEVVLTISDNGRGFKQDFLDKISTPSGLDAYINKQVLRSSDKIAHLPDRHREGTSAEVIRLFGGRGLGLRILMAWVERASAIERGREVQRYIKPDVSQIRLSNHPDASGHGAVIQIRTSVSPLEFVFSCPIAPISPASDSETTLSTFETEEVWMRSSSLDERSTFETDLFSIFSTSSRDDPLAMTLDSPSFSHSTTVPCRCTKMKRALGAMIDACQETSTEEEGDETLPIIKK